MCATLSNLVVLCFLIPFCYQALGIAYHEGRSSVDESWNEGSLLNTSSRITQGETIDIKEVPFVVRIVVRFIRPVGVQICSGILINSKFVLTAAHCIAGIHFDTRGNQPPFECYRRHYSFAPKYVWVIAGGSKNGKDLAMMKSDAEILQDGKRLPVRRVIPHCGYMDMNTGTPDFGLLELEQPIPSGNDKIKFIGIRETTEEFENEPRTLDKLPWKDIKDKAMVVGWGSTIPFNAKVFVDAQNGTGSVPVQNSPVLLQASFKLNSLKKCLDGIKNYQNPDNYTETEMRKKHLEIEDYEYCVTNDVEKDACYGDSGGPLICFDKTTGKPWVCAIVSRGHACGDMSTIYTIPGTMDNRNMITQMMKNTNEKCKYRAKLNGLKLSDYEMLLQRIMCGFKQVLPRSTCKCSKINQKKVKRPR